MFAQLVSKIFNLCGPDPPTSQTDDMRSQDRALHYSTSRGKNETRIFLLPSIFPIITSGVEVNNRHVYVVYVEIVKRGVNNRGNVLLLLS